MPGELVGMIPAGFTAVDLTLSQPCAVCRISHDKDVFRIPGTDWCMCLTCVLLFPGVLERYALDREARFNEREGEDRAKMVF